MTSIVWNASENWSRALFREAGLTSVEKIGKFLVMDAKVVRCILMSDLPSSDTYKYVQLQTHFNAIGGLSSRDARLRRSEKRGLCRARPKAAKKGPQRLQPKRCPWCRKAQAASGLKLYTTSDCEICFESSSERVVFDCGHCVCKACFAQL